MPDSAFIIRKPSSISYAGTFASVNEFGRVSFSGVTSLSLDGVFTSSYDNYMIMMNASPSTNGVQYQFRLRLNGTNNSTANSYVRQYLNAGGTAVDTARQTGDVGSFNYTETTNRAAFTQFIFGPNLAQPTAYRSITQDARSGAAILDYAGTHNQSTAYDGITMFPQAGSFTGTVAIFGCNQ